MVSIDTIDGAIDFVLTHRHVKPPVYNTRRLKEMPLPSLGIHGDHLRQFYARNFDDSFDNVEELVEFERGNNNTNDISTEFDETDCNNDSLLVQSDINTNSLENNDADDLVENFATAENDTNSQDQATVNDGDNLPPQNEFSTNPLANNYSGDSSEADAQNSASALVQGLEEIGIVSLIEPLIDQITNENPDEMDPLENIGHEIQIKPELVPMYEIHAGNASEVNELLDEPETVYLSDDDGEMIIPETGLPKPFGTTQENIVKRENDPITGNVPFNVEVNILS